MFDMLVQLIKDLEGIGHQWPWPTYSGNETILDFAFPHDILLTT